MPRDAPQDEHGGQPVIGYYVHHHGVGHLTRTSAITACLDEPVVVLSSRPRPVEHPFAGWVELPLDVDDAAPSDPTAHDVVHWAPVGVAGLRRRMAALAEWVERSRPRLVVVDVSVEVAAFVRLMGVPVVVVALPGERGDEAHQLAYRLADAILAPWAQSVYDPAWLHAFAGTTTYTGSISRHAGRSAPRGPVRRRPRALVLGGAGGSSLDADRLRRWMHSDRSVEWTALGIDGASWVSDVWPALRAADVVVAAAGQNAVADVAAAAAPAVIVPQHRPYGEQHATASALDQLTVASVRPEWPVAEQWREALDDALHRDATLWRHLEVGGAAERAAAVLRRV